jgi:hypothetical protein
VPCGRDVLRRATGTAKESMHVVIGDAISRRLDMALMPASPDPDPVLRHLHRFSDRQRLALPTTGKKA